MPSNTSKKLVVTIILLSIFSSAIPRPAFGLNVPNDIGTGNDAPGLGESLNCSGTWLKLICILKKTHDFIQTVQQITNILGFIPHTFPFGGPILSSETACSFHFDEYTFAFTICTPFTGCWTPALGPVPISIPLGGRAIRVGDPMPITPPTTAPYGRIIAFPWISKIYDQHTENRAGPWSLGLGFTPFPLGEINNSLGSIKIRIPPNYLDSIDAPCWTPVFGSYIGVCIDDLRFDCLASDEKDSSGLDIYKVIMKLGTSLDDAPPTAFPTNFPFP